MEPVFVSREGEPGGQELGVVMYVFVKFLLKFLIVGDVQYEFLLRIEHFTSIGSNGSIISTQRTHIPVNINTIQHITITTTALMPFIYG